MVKPKLKAAPPPAAKRRKPPLITVHPISLTIQIALAVEEDGKVARVENATLQIAEKDFGRHPLPDIVSDACHALKKQIAKGG